MIRLHKIRAGEYDVMVAERAEWSLLASIRRQSSGASRWRVRTTDGALFGGRYFNSLTAALDATIVYFGHSDDARVLVDQMMIESGRAAPRRKSV